MGLQNYPKILKINFWKLLEFWSEFSSPPGISLQKSPITFFSQVKIQKLWEFKFTQKFWKRNFQKLQQFWSEFCSPPGMFLQKSRITFFSWVNIHKAIALQIWLKILKTKFWKFTRVLVRGLSPTPRNSSSKNPHNIFRSGQNPKIYRTSNLSKNFENQILKSYKSSGQSSVPHLEYFHKKAL